MLLVFTAVFLSLCAFISGFAVIGSGRLWQYEPEDLFLGKVNALLYVWVILSTIFSAGHFLSLLDYGLRFDFLYRNEDTERWMALHSGVGLLFTTAHVFIRRYLSNGHGDQYLWGKRRHAE